MSNGGERGGGKKLLTYRVDSLTFVGSELTDTGAHRTGNPAVSKMTKFHPANFLPS